MNGAGDRHEDSFRECAQFLNDNNISWVFGSFSNKDEESSVLNSDYLVSSGESINDHLSETGLIVKELLKR